MNILAKQVKCYQCNEKIDDEKFITGRVLKEDKNGKERSYKKTFMISVQLNSECNS